MKPDEIDAEIADWNGRIALARENIDAFCKLPEYERATRNGQAGNSGTIVQQMQELQLSLDAIANIVDRAAELRAKLPRAAPAKSIAEIQAWLEGPSIVARSGQTPAERRELLRPVEATQSITPRQLLQSMLDSFRFLRDSVLEADRALAGELDRSRLEIAAAQGAFAQAKSSLETLTAAHTRANELDAERLTKVDLEEFATPSLNGNATAIDALCQTLQKLQAASDTTNPGATRVGLEKLSQTIADRLSVERQRIRAAESALNARRDLRGLLEALIAKAKDRGRANEPELTALADQAIGIFHRRPTPMKQAKGIVAAYEARLL